jgi:serine/threonine protein kinase
MTATACPTRTDWNRLATGAVSDQEADQLSGHLENCPHCHAVLEALERQAFGAVMQFAGISRADLDGGDVTEFLPWPSKPLPNRPTNSQTPPVPLPGFLWQGLIGGGGMGQVWRAWDERLQRVVAVKLLYHASAKSLGRFLREMQVVAALDHPNIVRALHAGEADGVPFLVMEYIPGANLAEVERAAAPLSVADAGELVRQMALAVSHFHVVGKLIHRDIKPANAMLAVDGKVKLLDLGLAVFVERDAHSAELTSEGNVLGTLNYMSPEQLNNSRDVDQRSDVYALGATLYRLLAGEAPHSRAASLLERLQAAQRGDIAPLQSLRPDVPDGLANIMHQALAARREDRWPDAASLAEALVPFARGADLPRLAEHVSRRNAKADTVDIARPPLSTLPGSSSRPDAAPPRRPSALLLAVILVVATLGVCGWLANVGRNKPRAVPASILPKQATTEAGIAEPAETAPSLFRPTEPPPLEEWLADRKILTVAQNGNAEFSSINSAIRELQPGQVVEILDRGPYNESLDIVTPPADTGLISRCDTIIDGIPEQLPRTLPHLMNLHRIHNTVGFRLRGLVFRSDDTANTVVLDGTNVRGLVLEHCIVWVHNPRHSVATSDWFSIPLVRLFLKREYPPHLDPPPVVIRNCAFATPLGVFMSDSASNLLVRHNWFNRSLYCSLNIGSIPDHFGNHAVEVRENLFDGTIDGTGMAISQDQPDRKSQFLTVANNTFLGFARTEVNYRLLRQPVVAPHTSVVRNHFHVPFGCLGFQRSHGALANDAEMAAAANRQWQIVDNSSPFFSSEPGILCQPGGMRIWPTILLSQDRADRDYLRFPADSPLQLESRNGSPTWIGALPPGPAPPEGDWFTNLLDRWNSVPERK